MKKTVQILTLALALTVGARSVEAASVNLGSPAVYSISPGLSFIGGLVGPHISTYIGLAPIAGHEFFIGGDLGVAMYLPGAFLLHFSILPTAWYQFRLPNSRNIRLVAGMSFGPAVIVGTAGPYIGTGVSFEAYFRPGFLIQTSSSVLIGGDIKIGSVRGAFAFRPTVNFVYPL